jgi:hypothetical protein
VRTGAGGRAEVDAGVAAQAAEHRVAAHAEAAGHAGEGQRFDQVGLAQALAVEVVVGAGVAAGGLEPHRVLRLARLTNSALRMRPVLTGSPSASSAS